MSQFFQNKGFRKAVVVLLSTTAIFAGVIGVYRAIHSPLFLVQIVEVNTQNADQISISQSAPQRSADPSAPVEDPANEAWTPLDAEKISNLASVPIGQVNLFDLDLQPIERRILKNEWIREVKLQKRFPQTLSITAVFREPIAILSIDNGSLAYVDVYGKVFGKLNLLSQSDLPLMSGFELENPPELLSGIALITQWEKSSLGHVTRLQSLAFDSERGYRALVSYEIKGPLGHQTLRTRVDLGLEKESLTNGRLPSDQIQRLTQVFEYLRQNSIAARQVFADAGKKIVVKTAHGS